MSFNSRISFEWVDFLAISSLTARMNSSNFFQEVLKDRSIYTASIMPCQMDSNQKQGVKKGIEAGKTGHEFWNSARNKKNY